MAAVVARREASKLKLVLWGVTEFLHREEDADVKFGALLNG